MCGNVTSYLHAQLGMRPQRHLLNIYIIRPQAEGHDYVHDSARYVGEAIQMIEALSAKAKDTHGYTLSAAIKKANVSDDYSLQISFWTS